jgi:hypothetical protein
MEPVAWTRDSASLGCSQGCSLPVRSHRGAEEGRPRRDDCGPYTYVRILGTGVVA